jgi:sugar phosphate isomerase/epimerase
MRLGLEAGAFTHDLAVELGIRGVPISADQLVNDGVANTLAPLQARGLAVCQIGAFGYNPLSSDVAGQAAQSELLRKAIPLAAETGCPYLVIGPGNYHPSGFGSWDNRNALPVALDRMAEALKPMLELAVKHGANLSFEAYLKGVINSPQRFLALWEMLGAPNLRCNVDPSSLYNYEDLLDPRARVDAVCRGLAGHYGLVHLKEIALIEGFHISAGLAPLGKGNTDWSQMLALIAPHVPSDAWVMYEHVLSAEEGREGYRWLQAAADRAGVTLK